MNSPNAFSVDQAMKLAIAEAKKGAPYVAPNPNVGCVILDAENNFLSSGFHEKYGEAHAEVNALKELSVEQLKSATVIVTLEPCAHEGKTPSCAKNLARLPIKKVIFGLVDPNPLVAGQGVAILEASGIEVEEYQGLLKSDLYDVCEIFLKNFTEKKTFVAIKMASSLDGQIGLKTGESQWLTGPEARLKAHALRAEYDATVVGRKTIEIDNPSLDIRHPEISKKNKIIVIDPSAQILKKYFGIVGERKNFKIFSVHNPENIYFAVTKETANELTHLIEKITITNNERQMFRILISRLIVFSTMADLLSAAWEKGLKSIFVEGGAATISSFIQDSLVDRLYVFLAPSLVGAQNGLSWTKDFGIRHLTDKKKLTNMTVQLYGQDLLICSKIER